MNLRTYPALQKIACQHKVLEIAKSKMELPNETLVQLASEHMTFKLAKDTIVHLMNYGKLALDGDTIKFVEESAADFLIESYDQVKQNPDGSVTLWSLDFTNSTTITSQQWQEFLYQQIGEENP